MKPKRIQRKRSKGWRKPENAIIIDRTSRYGNPFKVGQRYRYILALALMGFKDDDLINGIFVKDNAHAVELYKRMINVFTAKARKEFFATFKGKDVVCFCKLDEPCHGDVILKEANK